MMTIINNEYIVCYFNECINHSVAYVYETWAMLSVKCFECEEKKNWLMKEAMFKSFEQLNNDKA